MFDNVEKRNELSLQRTFHACFLPSFCSFSQAVSERKFFQKSIKQKQELPVAAMFVTGSERNEKSLQKIFQESFLPNFDAFEERDSEERLFRNQPIRNKNCLWQPYLVMDRDKMCNLQGGPSIDAFYQVSVHLGKRFQRKRFFRNQPNRNKNCLWWPCLLTYRI